MIWNAPRTLESVEKMEDVTKKASAMDWENASQSF